MRAVMGVAIAFLKLGLTASCAQSPSHPVRSPSPEMESRRSEPDRVCEVGDATACESAGEERTQVGDHGAAVPLYGAACKAGRPTACNRLAWLFNTGLGVAKSERTAFEWASRSCDLGDAAGCASVAILLANGDEVTRDPIRARMLARTWCDRGGALACDAYGRMLFKAGERARGAEFYERACNLAERDREGYQGCTELAEVYRDGAGLPQDAEKAMGLAAKACDASMPRACNLLGWIYWEGRLVPRDATRAITLFSRACDNGDVYGCTNLGVRYWHGEGVEVDKKRAAELFRWSCARQLRVACDDLTHVGEPEPGAGSSSAPTEPPARSASKPSTGP
jgi:TPR repeat protein